MQRLALRGYEGQPVFCQHMLKSVTLLQNDVLVTAFSHADFIVILSAFRRCHATGMVKGNASALVKEMFRGDI